MRIFRSLVLAALVGLLSGCSLFGIDKSSFDIPEPQLYAEALTALEDPNYDLAIEKLEQLESRYPFGRFSEQAQLELIFAYYKAGRPEQAKAAADRFIRLHPQHENIDYAYYLRGLTNFDADTNITDRWLPTDSSQRDPGGARDSFNDFSTLTSRYPNSQYAPDARMRMIFLRNQLAAYELHVARYYITRGAFIAAANRGRYVVENYQETPSVPEALAIMVATYDELGMTDLASDARTVLNSNFPDYGRALEASGPSLLNRLTLGLFGDGGR
jgi:outer membrane protein assembly factor BamD